MTWIEVVSDAVKIGLGALIGAIAAIVNAKINHDHKKNEEYSKRRRDSLESIMPDFEGASIETMQIAVAVPRAFDDTPDETRTGEPASSYQPDIRKTQELNLTMARLESRVTLLGFEALAEKIEDFRSGMNELLTLEVLDKSAAAEKLFALDDLKTDIEKGFADAYKNA